MEYLKQILLTIILMLTICSCINHTNIKHIIDDNSDNDYELSINVNVEDLYEDKNHKNYHNNEKHDEIH